MWKKAWKIFSLLCVWTLSFISAVGIVAIFLGMERSLIWNLGSILGFGLCMAWFINKCIK